MVFFLGGWWCRGPVPKSERKSPLHCLQWPPDLDLVQRAALLSVCLRGWRWWRPPWPKAIVCGSAVEKTMGCWTMILGSWFSITHAIVLFGVCYYIVALLFSCFDFWFVLDYGYSVLVCKVRYLYIAWVVVQQQDRLLSKCKVEFSVICFGMQG